MPLGKLKVLYLSAGALRSRVAGLPRILSGLILLFSFVFPSFAAAEIVVVVHSSNPVEQLSREQVVDIYMGRYNHFPDGQPAKPVDQAADSVLRETYYEKLINKTVAQVNAFWARLLFSGRSTPPMVLPDAQAVINFVSQNKNAIAYIDSQFLSDKTKVVYRLP